MADIAGFAPGGVFMGQDDATIKREIEAMDRTGITWFRFDFGWQGMEPSPGRYNFGKHERVVALLKKHGIRPIAMVAYTPTWARPRGCGDMMCPPSDPGTYGRFMRKLVSHFSPRGVKHYEIWNEPNQHFWWKPKPSPRAYTALLRAAYPAAKSADRGVTIIAGAFAPTADHRDGLTIRSTTYVRNLYYNGARRYFDAISIHPYNFPYAPDTKGDWNMITGVMPDIYATMKANGDGHKKIWGTESGYVTAGHKAVNERTQGLFIQQSYQVWTRYHYTAALITFNYRDMAVSREAFDNFGLVRRNWTPKASLPIFIQTMQMRQN